MRKIICLLILVNVSVFYNEAVYSQEQMASGIIYGNDWACIVSAPNGWIMDTQSLSHYNIFALFYEKGKTFGGDTPIIYINTTGLNNNNDEEMEKFIIWDLENHNKNGSKITRMGNELNGINDTYFIYNIENARGQFETIIYRRFKTSCFSIILNAPNEVTRQRLFSNMVEVVNSMGFMDKN